MATSRLKFGNFQDWHDFTVSRTDVNTGNIAITADELKHFREVCYKEIEALRDRPLLVYGSHFLSQLPPNAPISIDLNDVDGFTDLINSVDPSEKEVDVIIHSPGGSPDATERIVELLRGRFNKVHFLIPHSAYSAASMLAMSGDTITMHTSGVLGPIDPQINGVPARQIKRAFLNLQQKVAKEGQSSIIVYLPLIEKYDLHLLEMCDDSEKLSKNLVKDWLKRYMLHNLPVKKRNAVATKITNYMADFDKHLLHSKPLDTKKLMNYGVDLKYADKELNALLREAHILMQQTFNGFNFIKLYESAGRTSYGIQISPGQ